MDETQSLAHTTWECKVPHRLDSQVSPEGVVRPPPATPGERATGTGAPRGMRGGGGPSAGGPRARAPVGPAQVRGRAGRRGPQGEERHPHCAERPSGAGRTSPASSFGPAATTSPPLGETKPAFESTSRNKRRRISASTNSRSLRGNATCRWR